MVARTLSAVAELNVPDALRDGPRHYTDLARAVGADQRSLHRTMRMLASTGVFAEPQPGTFALTPVSTLLRSDIPGSMRDMAVMITAESHRDEPSCPRSVVDAGYTPAVRTRVGRRAGQHGCERAVVTAPDVLGPPGPCRECGQTPRRHHSSGPTDLAGKEVLTEEEWALRNPESGLSDDRPGPDVGFYNDFWLDQGVLSRRTSLIVDPPDGQFPPVTSAEQQGQRRRSDSYIGDQFDSWKDFNTYDRCITRGLPGTMVPGFYNHNYQILQTPDYVVIVVEMIHDARIIPLDGRSHISPTIRQWLGDSREDWEGKTLVVETTNSTDKVQARGYPRRDIHTVFGGDDQLRLVERFTRIDANTIDYQFNRDRPNDLDRTLDRGDSHDDARGAAL